MALVKALCVWLLLYSAGIGASRTAGKDPNSEKRALGLGNQATQATANAQQLVQDVRSATGSVGSQCGFLYLQPTDQNGVTLNDTTVSTTLAAANSLQPPTTPWPDPNGDSNFRMCFVDYTKPRNTNYGHPEYQLLFGDQLRRLITRIGACPQYVILYSSNLPCVSPQNPNPIIPRCAPLVVITRQRLAGVCPNAAFYLYTDQETPASVDDPNIPRGHQINIERKIDALDFATNDIIWIHP